MKNLHLEKFTVGATLAILKKTGGGNFSPTGITKVEAWDERFGVWRAPLRSAIPADGRGFFAMHDRTGSPHFYYSANPAHVKEARLNISKEKERRRVAEEINESNLLRFNVKLKELLDEYGATIEPVQLSGDDHGVELGLDIYISL